MSEVYVSIEFISSKVRYSQALFWITVSRINRKLCHDLERHE